MTDRIYAYTVTLLDKIREGDAEAITNAIKMIRGVDDVIPLVASPEIYWAVEKARQDLGRQLLKIVYPEIKDD